MKSKITDLTIWEVEVQHDYPPNSSSRCTTTLLITLNWKLAISKAVAKAERFLKQNTNDYPNAEIRSARRKGIIDA